MRWWSTSTTKPMTITMVEITSTVPCTLSKSRLPTSFRSIRPTPGRLNTCSITTEPAIRLAIWTPRIDTTGIEALRRPWRTVPGRA